MNSLQKFSHGYESMDGNAQSALSAEMQAAVKKHPELEEVFKTPQNLINALKLSANGRLTAAQVALANIAQDFGENWPNAIQLYGYLAGPVLDVGHEDFLNALGEMILMRQSQQLIKQAQAEKETAANIERANNIVETLGGTDALAADSYEKAIAPYKKGTFNLADKTPGKATSNGFESASARLALLHGIYNLKKNGEIDSHGMLASSPDGSDYEDLSQAQHDQFVRMSMSDTQSVCDALKVGNVEKMPFAMLPRVVFRDGLVHFQQSAPLMMTEAPIAGKMPSNLPSSASSKSNTLLKASASPAFISALSASLASGSDLSVASNIASIADSLRPHLDAAHGYASPITAVSNVAADNSIAAQIARLRGGASADAKIAESASAAVAPSTEAANKPNGHPLYVVSNSSVYDNSEGKKKGMYVRGNFMPALTATLGSTAAEKAAAHLTDALVRSHANLGLNLATASRTPEGGYNLNGKVAVVPYRFNTNAEGANAVSAAFSVEPTSNGKNIASKFNNASEFGFRTINNMDSDLTLTDIRSGNKIVLPAKSGMLITKAITLHGPDHDTLMIAAPLSPLTKTEKMNYWTSSVEIPGTDLTGKMITCDSLYLDESGTMGVHRNKNIIAMDN